MATFDQNPSSDLQIRQDRAGSFNKLKANRSVIHKMVRNRLDFLVTLIVNKVLRKLGHVSKVTRPQRPDEKIVNGAPVRTWELLKDPETGEIDYQISDGEYKDLVSGFVPFFEICELCRWKKVDAETGQEAIGGCPIRKRLEDENAGINHRLATQALIPNLQIGTTFTVTQCGQFDLTPIVQLQREAKLEEKEGN